MNTWQIIVIIIITFVRSDEELKIKIGLPEYVCGKDGGVKDLSKNVTMIRLLGQGGQKIDYKFEVNFHTIENKCRNNQRCTLLMWKSVRELGLFLKSYPVLQLQSGLIEVNNTMFLPGIKYIINVTMTTDSTIKEQQLTLDYVDDGVREKIQKPMASLLLLAPDKSYAYTSFVANAEVNICSNISSYYFKWELDDSSNFTLRPSKSSQLILEPNTLRGSQIYMIKCSLMNTSDDYVMATNEQQVTVLSKGLVAKLALKRLTTGTNQPAQLNAYVKDLDNTQGDITISWSCFEVETNETCDYESDSSDLNVASSFATPGIYQIALEASKNEITASDFCIVEVKDDVPVVEVDEIEFPVNPSLGVEIRATIHHLVTFCSLQWTSQVDIGYEYLDLSLVPGNPGTVTNVSMKEDVFLNELEEFTNGTISKKHDLIIPPPAESWQGLKGDVNYLFRLTITCPLLSDDFNQTEWKKTITDVAFETNKAPTIKELAVTPLEGDAFLTTFAFKTLEADDKAEDYPILYKFGYVLGNQDVFVWNLGDVTNCEATLPYSFQGIQTFVETCDNYNSCSRRLGPLISTKMQQNINPKAIVQRFIVKMDRGDYDKAFSEAFTILFSFKQINITLDDVIMSRISQEIDNFLNFENYNEIVISDIRKFIETVNDYDTQIQFPETILNQLLELRNKITEDFEQYSQRKLLSVRATRSGAISLREVRTYLEISELIINTSNDPVKIGSEKENLRKQLHDYMEKLCASMKKPQLILEMKTVIFSVEKIKKSFLNIPMSIPFEGNSWQVMARVKFDIKDAEKKLKCVGRAVFRNYFNKQGLTYFAEILNNGNEKDFGNVVVYLPKINSAEGKPNCLVFYDNAWHSSCKIIQNMANYVKCSCKQTGYYYLEYYQTLRTTPKTVSTTVEHNISSNSNNTDKANTYDTISYIVITASLIGTIILIAAIWKIFRDDDDDEHEDETFEFPKYAQLHNEEYLNDAHI